MPGATLQLGDLPTMPLGAVILFAIAAILSVLSSIWFLVAAFRESFLWGLAVLLIPFAVIVFLFKKWEAAKKPFYLHLIALVLSVAGMLMVPMSTWKAYIGGSIDLSEFANKTPIKTELTFDEISEKMKALEKQEAQILVRKENLRSDDSEASNELRADIEAYNTALKALHDEPGYSIWKMKKESETHADNLNQETESLPTP